MTQNTLIKTLQESDELFDKEFRFLDKKSGYIFGEHTDPKNLESIKSFNHSRSLKLLESLKGAVISLRTERPINSYEDIAMALRKNLSEREKEHIREKDNGFYIKNVEFSVRSNLLDEISSLLDEAINLYRK